MDINISIRQALPLIDFVRTNQKVIFLLDTLELSDSLSAFTPIKIIQPINITHHVSYNKRKHIYRFLDTLSLTQSVVRSKDFLLIDYLHLSQSVNRSNVDIQHLALSQFVTVQKSKAFSHSLELSDFVHFTFGKYALTDTLSLTDFVGLVIGKKPWNRVENVVLFTSGPNKLNIGGVLYRNPDFGNSYEQNYRIINRESLGKDLIVSPKTDFSANKKRLSQTFTISALCQKDIDTLSQFINDTIGTTITITNNTGISFEGYVTTPDFEVTQPGREGLSIQLTLEDK